MIASTFNVHHKTLVKIAAAAARLKTSRRHIIMMLLMRMMDDHHERIRAFTAVKYQPGDKPENWHCFHIRCKPDEYEFYGDMRKLYKCSVSLLIAIAVEKYCDSLIGDDDVDKYPRYNNYVLHREIVDEIICWHSYWGYPEEHLKNILPIADSNIAYPDIPH